MRVSKLAPNSTATLLLVLALGVLCLAQAPSPASRQEVEKTIRAQARRDAARGRQREAGPLIDMYGGAAAAVGLAPDEIVNVYEKEYFEAFDAQPWWKDVSPQWGWLAAGLMLLLLVFRDVLKDTLKSAVTVAKDWVYKRISGYRLFRRTALRHYRRALTRRYHLLKIPFRPDQPLNVRDIYVPLKVKGSSDAEQVDAFRTMTVTRRMMVVGPPGSGKSMLLKHVALSYADGKFTHLPDRPIPILLELNRLNDSSRTVEEHLVDSLYQNDFHKARNFVDLGLAGGTLMLLFDGLDEVNRSRREPVVQAISDLLLKYPMCRAIITCRTAVYRNEFTEATDQTLEIVEFTDQQVHSFLSAWQPYMPAGKSIEQLVNTLQARPRIMALARNPLLLTIIAFLYTDTEFVLPDSRTEFYDQAIDVLLRQWKYEANRFKAPHKRIVLQHLALFNQESDAERGQDRRSIDLQTVIVEIKNVLPALNLELQEANPLLDEIVERSGLLLPIDGGAKYQFAHLTLQEFFAATALSTDEAGLLKRFLQDSDAWRETVKLWCGLEQDSTALVRSIMAHDHITAFECLADAQKISPALAEEIIDHFKSRLETDPQVDEAVVRAFAAVASGQSPRSQAVFGYLAGKLHSLSADGPAQAPSSLRDAAVMALALTNKPAAVTELLHAYDLFPEVRAAVVKMGDLAVKGLSDLCELTGRDESSDDKRAYAIQSLRDIGTPKAAAALVPMLWSDEGWDGLLAARALASLFGQPLILDALRQYSLNSRQRASAEYSFVWAPFTEDAGTSLPTIAARCAELLYIQAGVLRLEEYFRSRNLDLGRPDLKLIVPLILKDGGHAELVLTHLMSRRLPSIVLRSRAGQPSTFRGGAGSEERHTLLNGAEPRDWSADFRRFLQAEFPKDESESVVASEDVVAAYMAEKFRLSNTDVIYRLLMMLNPLHQLTALFHLFDVPRPNLKDWATVTQRNVFKVVTSWQYKVTQMLVALFGLVALYGAGSNIYFNRSVWSAAIGVSLVASIALSAYIIVGSRDDSLLIAVVGGPFVMPYTIMKELGALVSRRTVDSDTFWIAPMFFLMSTIILYYAYEGASRQVGKVYALLSLAVWGALVAALLMWAKRKERKRRNPLWSLLDNAGQDEVGVALAALRQGMKVAPIIDVSDLSEPAQVETADARVFRRGP